MPVGCYENKWTAKGPAIDVEEGLVKGLVPPPGLEIVGAHIVGPRASVRLRENVNRLYTPERSGRRIVDGMHLHPALDEVVEGVSLNRVPARTQGRGPPRTNVRAHLRRTAVAGDRHLVRR